MPPVINTKQTTLSGGAPLPVSCASGNVGSCMATANQNLLVSACKEVNATAPTASTKSMQGAINYNFTPLKKKNRVDYSFISRREQPGGAIATTGYIPNKNGIVTGHSGVTIGIGVDLGKLSVADLKKFGLSERLINKLTPYLGLRKQQAYNFLLKDPLTLNIKQAEELTKAVQTHIIDTVAQYYSKYSAPPVNFFSLPSGAQTVIADIAYQYGPALFSPKATPHFWYQVTHGNWINALVNLEHFGDTYPTRRMKEAYLLDINILDKKIPEKLTAVC